MILLTVLVISRTKMQSGELTGVTNIAYSSANNEYTLTYASGTTQTYSASLYYLTVLWV